MIDEISQQLLRQPPSFFLFDTRRLWLGLRVRSVVLLGTLLSGRLRAVLRRLWGRNRREKDFLQLFDRASGRYRGVQLPLTLHGHELFGRRPWVFGLLVVDLLQILCDTRLIHTGVYQLLKIDATQLVLVRQPLGDAVRRGEGMAKH